MLQGDARKIPQPPKFGATKQGNAPGPSTLADWVSFWRWLVNLWQVASNSTDAQEVITIAPRPSLAGQDENLLGAAQAFAESRPALPASRDIDAGAVASFSAHAPARTNPADELNTLMQLALSKVPYPLHQSPQTITIEDAHQRRYTSGSITTAGTTLTRLTGIPFRADMVGQFIAISIPVTGYVLYKVVSFTSGTIIDIDTNIGVLATTFIYTAYPSTAYARGTLFFELDRKLFYLNCDSAGFVNTAGTTVTRTSGDFFDPYWDLGASIVINGVSYPIDHVTTAGQLILKVSAGVQAAVFYTVGSGKWIYTVGEYFDSLANIPPDAGAYDHGMLFFDTTYWHLMRFDISIPGWQFAPGDSGSGYIVADGGIQYPQLYASCDGTNATISKGDGTTVVVTTPNLVGDVFLKGASATGAQQAATVPTWQGGAKTDDATSAFTAGAKTEDEAAHDHHVMVNSSDGGAAGADFDFAHPGDYLSGPGSAHHHDVTNVDAPQDPHHHTLSDASAKLNAPSEGAGGLPLRIALAWRMRI